MNQSKSKLLIASLILIATLGLSAWAVSTYLANDNTNNQTKEAATQVTEMPRPGRTEITYQAQAGITSLEQLKDEAKDVVVEESEYGALVNSIEGHEGGTDGKYWSFYVNGKMAEVGADAYMQQEGDFIEWKFQKL